MSELKGQLLGIVLVLIVFGTIAGVMRTAFNTLTTTVSNQVTDIDDELAVIGYAANE